MHPGRCRAQAHSPARGGGEKAGHGERLLDDIELPLVRVLAGMELAGVRLDVAALNDAARDMEERIAALEGGDLFARRRTLQHRISRKGGEVLFDRLKLDAKARKTKTGQYSTSEDILENWFRSIPWLER